ncbi:MAG: hypothetical protein QOE68_1946, partial [Thermoanaerobaculia bacterium]|nr:hypothetical protein [Thermoanaerobaculia bacterium]
ADGWASRMVKSPGNRVGYVYLARNGTISKELRAKELWVRCFIARAMLPDIQTVIGLATEVPGTAEHISWIVTCFSPEPWPAHDQLFAGCLSRISGMFCDVRQYLDYESEFPLPDSQSTKHGD